MNTMFSSPESTFTLTSLSKLILAQSLTEQLAKPHRLFNVDAVQGAAWSIDARVQLRLVCTECANTGCSLPLDRFEVALLDESGERSSVVFFVDLIQNMREMITDGGRQHPAS